MSALPRDFAELDTLILQRRNVGTSRRKCEKKPRGESLRDKLARISALTPSPVLIHLRSLKGAMGKLGSSCDNSNRQGLFEQQGTEESVVRLCALLRHSTPCSPCKSHAFQARSWKI